MTRHRIATAATAALLLGALAAPAAAAPPDRTILPDRDEVTVAAAGDIACSPASTAFHRGRGTGRECRQQATAAAAAGVAPDAVFALGDNQYEYGELANFRRSFQPSWGRWLSVADPGRNRLWPIPGNHELAFRSASGYWPFFNGGTEPAPVRSGIAGQAGKGWYTLHLGQWQVLALNSECGFPGAYLGTDGCAAGSPQYRWVQRQLATAPECTLAMFHRPRVTVGHHPNHRALQPLWKLLAGAGVELALSGHNHDYERFAPLGGNGQPSDTGIQQFVVGTGGKDLYAWGRRGDAIQPDVKANTTAGVLQLTLRADGYDWRFVRADFPGNGSFTDAGSRSCQPAPTG